MTSDHDASDTSRPADGAVMSEAQLAEARRYHRQGLICDLLDRGIDLAFLTVVAVLLARPLDAYLAGIPLLAPMWLRLPAFVLIVFCAHWCVSFPLSFYAGHVVEHRFGLSRQTLGAWLKRYALRVALTTALMLALMQGLMCIVWSTGPYWWLVAAAAFFVVSVVLGQLMPVVFLPLFYKVERLDNPALADGLKRLAEGTGLSIEGVFKLGMSVETAKANAMLAGLGRTRRVILGDTLLAEFSPEEIEVIFAHEIGHHVHRHVRKMIAAGLAYSAVSFFLFDRLIVGWIERFEGGFDYSVLPVYAVAIFMLVMKVLEMLLEPIFNVISRRHERQSDRYALKQTGNVAAFRTAFRKLAQTNKEDPDPHPVEVFLWHSHPPISQRLALADQFDTA